MSHHFTRNTRESCPVAWQWGCVPAWWHILSVGWVSEREHANILPKRAATCLVQVLHVFRKHLLESVPLGVKVFLHLVSGCWRC